MLKVSDIIQIKIDKMVFGGEGLGYFNDFAVFVPMSVPEDELEIEIISVKKTYARGLIKNIIKASPERVDNHKFTFEDFYGCDFAMLKYESQLKYKKLMVEEVMRKIAGLSDIEISDVLVSEDVYNYRNKIIEPFSIYNNKIITGFFRRKSHEVFEVDENILNSKLGNRIIKELKEIFAQLKADAILLKEKGDKKLIHQIHYWLDNTVDQMNALEALLTATEGLAEKNDAKVWDNYYAGLKHYDQSISYAFFYVDHYERAEFGVQHIRPFINNLKEYLATHIQTMLRPDKLVTTFITNRAGAEGGLAEVTDGDYDTHVIVKTTTVIERDDYVGLRFNKAIKIHTLGFATGTKTADNYTFGNAVVEYQNEQGDWVALTTPAYTGRERTLEFNNLDITAQAVRMRATAKKDNAWLAMREIAVNRPLEMGSKKV